MNSDPYVFLAIDYMATGEGRSTFLLVTRANPRKDETALKSSPKDIALRELRDRGVGSYFLQGVEELSREEFLSDYDNFLPEFVIKILNETDNDAPFNFHYFVDIHYNYS